MTKIYARIENNAVAELFATSGTITSLFHPSLQWVDVTGQPVQVGWVETGKGAFAPPSAASQAAVVTTPTIAEILAELAALKAQVETLSGHQ